jgi:site-specific DNA recombinase
MPKSTKKVIGIYIRVNQKEVFSLDEQKEECTQTAYALFGKEVAIEYYIDERKDARITKNRASLLQMLQDAKRGMLSAVITYEVSRLARNLSDSLRIIEEICKDKVRFISIKEGEYGTPHGNFHFNILSFVAQYLRTEHSGRIKLGIARQKMDTQQVLIKIIKKENV